MTILRAEMAFDRLAMSITTTPARHPGRAVISITARSREARLTTCHGFEVLVDGLLIDPVGERYEGSGAVGAVVERVHVEVSYQQLAQIARGTEVRWRVCRSAFRIDADQRATIRALLEEAGEVGGRERPIPEQPPRDAPLVPGGST